MFSARTGAMKSSRLLSILLLLQTHERMTSQELTRRFEISPRTILRDVEALPVAGVPIHTVARSCWTAGLGWTSLVSIRESFSCSLSRGWTPTFLSRSGCRQSTPAPRRK
ncbi:HTH domain-containing protein [Cutibacterium acnes]